MKGVNEHILPEKVLYFNLPCLTCLMAETTIQSPEVSREAQRRLGEQ